MHTFTQVLLVGTGSFIGGVTRWGVGLAFGRLTGTAFPFGTLFINITGSLFLGWFTTVLGARMNGTLPSWLRPDDLRLLVAVGFTGAYTTFSTFEYETHELLADRTGLVAAAYVALSVFVGLLAVRLGIALGRAG